MAFVIRLNGEDREIDHEKSLEDLLGDLSLPKQRVAIELNKTVVARNDWQRTIVRESDVIEVVHFVGGG